MKSTSTEVWGAPVTASVQIRDRNKVCNKVELHPNGQPYNWNPYNYKHFECPQCHRTKIKNWRFENPEKWKAQIERRKERRRKASQAKSREKKVRKLEKSRRERRELERDLGIASPETWIKIKAQERFDQERPHLALALLRLAEERLPPELRETFRRRTEYLEVAANLWDELARILGAVHCSEPPRGLLCTKTECAKLYEWFEADFTEGGEPR